MSTPALTFETGHNEMIHDAQMDYYGKRLATASADRTIRIFELGPPNQPHHQLLSNLFGHDAPIWQLAWAHPRFGCILASVSYDGRVILWKETAQGRFDQIYQHAGYRQSSGAGDASANSVSFAPHQCGLQLAVGRSDGTVAVYTRLDNNTFDEQHWVGHQGGVNAVSWASQPVSSAPGQQQQQQRAEGRFVSGGCDNRLRIWRFDPAVAAWTESGTFAEQVHHSDWIRDVAWAPSIGLPNNLIASASEDKTVCIWQEDATTGQWQRVTTLNFTDKVWRVSWSVMGNILAVAQGDNKVSLWKETAEGEWQQISNVAEQGVQPPQQQQQVQDGFEQQAQVAL